MAENANPSKDPANDGTPVGMMRTILDKFLQNVDDMLPAIVVAYDRASNRAQVQPLMFVVSTAGERVQRAQVASVPVLQIGGGNFMLNFPLQSGDLGWIKASDRDISLFAQSGKNESPNTRRKHSFEDGLFIPDIMRGYTIAGEDASNAVLQNKTGTVRVSIWPNKVKITAPTVEINSPETSMTGNLTVVGNATISGIPFNTHRHTGVNAGPNTSGGPVA